MYTTTELYTVYTTIQNQLNTESSIQNQFNTESTIQNQLNTESTIQIQLNTESTIQSQWNTESTIQNQLNSESTIANGVAKEDPHILAIEEPTILAKRTRNFSNRRAGVALRAQRDKGLITPWG